jgi:hypothetical protein
MDWVLSSTSIGLDAKTRIYIHDHYSSNSTMGSKLLANKQTKKERKNLPLFIYAWLSLANYCT